MDDVGARLKRAREERGISLSEIAVRTKISAVALEALERNDLTRLPGGIFGRNFVKSYALEIGIDPEDAVAAFHRELERRAREAAARDAAHPEITADDREFAARQRAAVRTLRLVIAVLAGAVLLFVIWRLQSPG